jgi:hypothetical protein
VATGITTLLGVVFGFLLALIYVNYIDRDEWSMPRKFATLLVFILPPGFVFTVVVSYIF